MIQLGNGPVIVKCEILSLYYARFNRMQYGNYLEAMGRVDQAIAERRRALEAEPLSLINSAVLGRNLYEGRQYDQAMEELRKTLDMDPGFVQAHLYLGWVYEQKRMFAEAIAELRQAVGGSGGNLLYVGALGHAYAIAGERKMAEECLARLQALQRYVSPNDMAVIHIGLGDKEQAWKYLQKAYEDHSYWILFLRIDPRFDGIRGDPRYQDLLRRMHLSS